MFLCVFFVCFWLVCFITSANLFFIINVFEYSYTVRMPNSLDSEHLVQIDCKDYQQTTKVAASKESIGVALNTHVRT